MTDNWQTEDPEPRSTYLLVDVVGEIVERRVRDQPTEANGEREEALGDSLIPDANVKQLTPLRCEEEADALPGTLERERTNQKDRHDDVREDGQEVRHFTGAFDAWWGEIEI